MPVVPATLILVKSMADQPKDAPAEEDKKTDPADAKADESNKDDKKDATVGEALKSAQKTEKKEEARMVPEAVLLEYKKENKELFKELQGLKKLIEDGANKAQIAPDIKSLAEKHKVDVDFLNEFAAAVRQAAKEDIKSEVKPIEEREQAARLETVFNENFDKTLSELPEYKSLVNKDVIRALAFDPRNANKTFAQIFEMAYGHLVTGKKTLDSTKPRGGKGDTKVDVARAQRDPEYFKEIMADPDLKRQYNEGLHDRIRV